MVKGIFTFLNDLLDLREFFFNNFIAIFQPL